MDDALDAAQDQPEELTLADVVLTDEDNKPVLGPLGQTILILWIIAMVVIFCAAFVWLFGYLAYPTPPVPGGG
jgi:hypothetical protein